MKELGVTLKLSKCVLEPVQKATVLGMEVNSKDCIFTAPLSAVDTIGSMARALLTKAQCWKRQLASLLGKINSVSLAVAPVPFWTMGMYRVLKSARGWKTKVQLTHWSKWELKFWAELPKKLNYRLFLPLTPEATMHTDASLTGWGAVLHRHAGVKLARGFWPDSHDKHINLLELWAVYLGLQQFKQNLYSKILRVVTDSQVVFYLLQRFSTTKDPLVTPLMMIYRLVSLFNIKILVEWIPTEQNSQADHLSRLLTHAPIDGFAADPNFEEGHPGWKTWEQFSTCKAT
jgi:hypothetical protein